jgi:copper chaperone CopZ
VKTIKGVIIGAVGLILVLTAGRITAESTPGPGLKRAVIKIDSLSCGGCFATINAGLETLEGYSGMGANLFRKLIAIDFAAPLTAGEISKKLSNMGYPGHLETVDSITEKASFASLESRRTGKAGNGGSCCSGGTLSRKSSNQGQPGLLLPQGNSCCTLPGAAQPTKPL